MAGIKGIRIKPGLVGILLVAAVILLVIIVHLRTGNIKPASPLDLSDHPVYSKYTFGESDNVIDVGTQPLGLTVNIITEVMKRDAVLKAALSEQGLEIRFHPFFKGADENFFLKRGDLDVVMAGHMPTLIAAAGSDIIVMAQNKLGSNSLVTKGHMPINDLKGKRIGYAFGSTAHYNILQLLSSEGLRERDVRLVDLNVNEMPDMLAEGKIDAFLAWEPTPTIALARFNNFVVIHRTLTSAYLYFSRSFVDQHLEAVRYIVAAQLRAIAWMKRERQNLLEACRWALQARKTFSGHEQQTLSVTQYASLVRDQLLDFNSVSFIPKQDMVVDGRLFREFEFLKTLGKMPPSSDWDSVSNSFDPAIINEVAANPKKYGLNEHSYDTVGDNIE